LQGITIARSATVGNLQCSAYGCGIGRGLQSALCVMELPHVNYESSKPKDNGHGDSHKEQGLAALISKSTSKALQDTTHGFTLHKSACPGFAPPAEGTDCVRM
jgi:hypothetical protein